MSYTIVINFGILIELIKAQLLLAIQPTPYSSCDQPLHHINHLPTTIQLLLSSLVGTGWCSQEYITKSV